MLSVCQITYINYCQLLSLKMKNKESLSQQNTKQTNTVKKEEEKKVSVLIEKARC